jgi:hypothetical protein
MGGDPDTVTITLPPALPEVQHVRQTITVSHRPERETAPAPLWVNT